VNQTFKQILITFTSIVLTAIVGLLIAWFWRSRDAKQKLQKGKDEEREQLKGRVLELEGKLEIVNTQAVGVNALVQSLLVKALTHFHTPVMDALMVKLGDAETGRPPTITDSELDELSMALKQRMFDMGPEISDDERDAAEALPAIIRRARREAQSVAGGLQFKKLQMVGILHEGENGG
jgi:hypothetical protein